ncbi:MAG: outer membrane protein assembly factor BamC [Gammaproteobacteria bacterium]
MAFPTIGKATVLVIALTASSACSRIKSYFPDKEKDYQFKTEIPELILPDDLGQHSIQKAPTMDEAVTAPTTADAEDKKEAFRVERINYDGGASRLRIDQPFSKTWHIVGKALARKTVEIVARNKPQGLFIVMYDPAEQKVTDDSLWDEVLFVFGQRSGNEQEYRIKLAEYDGYTEVLVMDEQDKPLSDGASLSLLQLMQEAMEDDLAGKFKAPSQDD